MFGQIVALDNRYWIVNMMEMFERLAYYGVRAVIAIYILDPFSIGGLGFTPTQKGTIFAWWAFVQSMLPMYTGGLADRYGHKNIVAIAIVLKIIGYVMMAWMMSFYGFTLGCMMLAAGTAIFKPGVQGTLAATMKSSEASLGWGIFYQLVNIGGFMGPVLAGYLRMMSWDYVFYSCAFIVAINFLWLPFYKSPTEEAREHEGDAKTAFDEETRQNWAQVSQSVSMPLAMFWTVAWTIINFGLSIAWWSGYATLSADDYALLTLMFGIFQIAFYIFTPLKKRFDEGLTDPGSVVVVSTVGIFQARVFFFCLMFAGFWVMFNQVFDLLPNTIDDWVDSSDVIGTLGAAFQFPAVPISLGVILAVILGGLCAVGVLLPMRPDRRAAKDVPTPAYIVVAVAFAAAMLPLVSSVTQGVAIQVGLTPAAGEIDPVAYPYASFVPVLGLAASLAGGILLSVVALLTRLPAKVVAPTAGVIGLVAWGWLGIESLLGNANYLVEAAQLGEQINPEWMINLNPGLIVFTMIFFAWISGFVKPLTSIIIGMMVATLGSVLAGAAVLGWVCLAGIFVFSVGEMLSSPKKMEYLATLARKGQEGLFMGYVNVPVALGWIGGSLFAGNRYEEIGWKIALAKRHLVNEVGMDPAQVEALDDALAVDTLAEQLQITVPDAQHLLFEVYDPWWIWVEIAAIGMVSVVGMIIYDRVIRYIDGKKGAEAAA